MSLRVFLTKSTVRVLSKSDFTASLWREVKNEEFLENCFGDLPLPPDDELFPAT